MSFYPDVDPEAAPAVRRLREAFGPDIGPASGWRGDVAVQVARERLLEALRLLRDDPACGFDFLMDLCAVDWLGREPRFELVYHLFSSAHRHRLRVKAGVPEGDAVADSATPIWKGADWFEREAYDLMGIRFRNHPFLRRILTHDEFQGHALRKDYDQRQRWRCTRVSDLEGTVEVPPAPAAGKPA